MRYRGEKMSWWTDRDIIDNFRYDTHMANTVANN